MRISVFCGASKTAAPQLLDMAYRTGRLLAERGHVVVYGGGNRGLMGEVARGAREAGGEVRAVTVPRWSHPEEDYKLAQEVTVAQDIAERKRALFEFADGFVVLPGSFGTFDEVALVMAEAQYGTHDKPIVCVSPFFESLRQLVEDMIGLGLADADLRGKIAFVRSPEALPF